MDAGIKFIIKMGKETKSNLKITESDGVEPKRIGDEAKMTPLTTGKQLSSQII